MWINVVVVASLVVLSASIDEDSEQKLRQVVHPPLSEEQHQNAALETKQETDKTTRKQVAELEISFYHGFLASLSVIIVSELGDKTWFIAVIMAMRHSRLTVFSGAMAALALMTVLSACLGWVTQLIPRMVTYYVSTALFALFGLKMLHEGYHMSASEGQASYFFANSEEFEEAQAEVAKREMDLDAVKFVDMEAGNAGRNRQVFESSSSAWLIFSFVSRIFIEAFTMTFVAEWGDRSQLTTIILAARENIAGVISGGILGHALCTGIAVVGGKLVAQRISVRTVTIVGGIVFLIFALSALFINDGDEKASWID
ncbi:hypothetical protein NECAME_15361 [Necator americanus]|uniref:GDT1 family protein n=2 Tax=Necator americanus TaxID=51031 RepID=W2SI76_NECAM|nr:hypothetical protein NECAME_15361 [Necator americanus]ETN69354.1 hypothetical protein NECAME_15361 [Necator americanus]